MIMKRACTTAKKVVHSRRIKSEGDAERGTLLVFSVIRETPRDSPSAGVARASPLKLITRKRSARPLDRAALSSDRAKDTRAPPSI